jgi:hypothetical protein
VYYNNTPVEIIICKRRNYEVAMATTKSIATVAALLTFEDVMDYIRTYKVQVPDSGVSEEEQQFVQNLVNGD